MVNKYLYKSNGNIINDSSMLDNTQSLIFATIKVANELAEANRLKRIQLSRQEDNIDLTDGAV